MKKVLLFITAVCTAFIMINASPRDHQVKLTDHPIARTHHPQAIQQEMQMAPATRPALAPIPDEYDIRYIRPAGAFCGMLLMHDGVYQGMYYSPYVLVKPFTPYTYHGVIGGFTPSSWVWSFEGWNMDTESWATQWLENEMDATVQYGPGLVETPLWIIDQQYYYQMGDAAYMIDPTHIEDHHTSYVIAHPSYDESVLQDGYEFLFSSKNMCYSSAQYPFTYYSGCQPYGDNEYGWWFGKNSGTKSGRPVDGIAQAFEQPAYPYLLKQVVVDATVLEVSAPVEMTCKIYRLNNIPAYQEQNSATLPEEPGELIATGKAIVTPETFDATGGLIVFTLYNEDEIGLEYEVAPTIDYPILVVVDGYNDPEMANLTDFSALISTNWLTDEGYGELAYLKTGLTDSEGNFTGEYEWCGLNNFFSTGTMKTGLSIFLTIEQPYITFRHQEEDGEYIFPVEGGVMEKVLHKADGTQVTTRSIEFLSWYPSADGDIEMKGQYSDELPEWLEIELTDGKDKSGAFDYNINAVVTAEPLPPEGFTYREATVTFEAPGCNISYTFKQGDNGVPTKPNYDVNGDGEVTIADVNVVIELILYDNYIRMTNPCDVNLDGEISIADVNAIIDYILNS